MQKYVADEFSIDINYVLTLPSLSMKIYKTALGSKKMPVLGLLRRELAVSVCDDEANAGGTTGMGGETEAERVLRIRRGSSRRTQGNKCTILMNSAPVGGRACGSAPVGGRAILLGGVPTGRACGVPTDGRKEGNIPGRPSKSTTQSLREA